MAGKIVLAKQNCKSEEKDIDKGTTGPDDVNWNQHNLYDKKQMLNSLTTFLHIDININNNTNKII